MVPAAISRLIILVIGALYPAYESYKTIRTRNIQRYVRWILYWIVYSLFICAETFADIFVSWLPFYYELKIVFVIWLVLPFTSGANILFRYFVRPQFAKWEEIADHILATLSRDSLSYILVFVTKGLHYIVIFSSEIALMAHSKITDYFECRKTGESEEVAMLTGDLWQKLDVNHSTSIELQKTAATRETREVIMSGSDNECSKFEPQLEIEIGSTSGELRRCGAPKETREMIPSTNDFDCSDIKPQVEVELHSTPTELKRKAAVAKYQEVIVSISDKEVSNFGSEPENELCSSTRKRKRKAAGRKMKKMEFDVAQQLSTESEQLNSEVSIRTTRAKKYVY